jgi:hypothetical protein
MYNDSRVLSSVREDVSWPTCSMLEEDIYRLMTLYLHRVYRCTARHLLPLRCILVKELERDQSKAMHRMRGDRNAALPV